MEENKAEFKFQTEIIRSEEVDGKVYLFGCASSTSLDSHETIFSEKCQEGFVEDCLKSNVLIEIVHGKLETENRFLLAVGKVVEAYLDRTTEEVRTMVKIELNPSHPYFNFIVDSLEGKNTDFGIKEQIGLSIYGFAKEFHYELRNSVQIKVFDRVKLTHIAIAEKPSNYDTFLEVVARSINIKEEEINRMKQDPKVIVEGINARIAERQKEITDKIQSFTSNLEILKASNFSVEDMAIAMKAFLESMYHCLSDKIMYLKWDGESLSEYEEKASEEMRTVQSSQFKIIDEILEIKRTEKESKEDVKPTVKCSESNTEHKCSATCEQTESGCEESNSIKSIENETGEKEVQEEKEEVEVEAEVQRTEVEATQEEVKEVEVTRSEFNSLKESIDKLTELISEVSRSSKESKVEASVESIVEKMDKVEKELEVLRNQPISAPIQNIPTNTTNTKNISREEELFRKVKDKSATKAEYSEWENSLLTRVWNK
jgi:hypothetical protein